MRHESGKNRIALLEKLLDTLLSTYERLDAAKSDIENSFGWNYKQTLQEKSDEIKDKINSFKNNLENIKNHNQQISFEINAWYTFSKDKEMMSRILYPLLFYKKKAALNRKIKRINEEISAIIIENRFIKEQYSILLNSLEIETIVKIKESDKYHEYEQLLEKKDLLEDELKYLVPTIPGLCPAELGVEGVKALLEKLHSYKAS